MWYWHGVVEVFWLLCLKSIGVKFKVLVTDEDGIWSRDDYVDGFVHLLQLTPAQNSSVANWNQTDLTVILGIRSRHKTKLVTEP